MALVRNLKGVSAGAETLGQSFLPSVGGGVSLYVLLLLMSVGVQIDSNASSGRIIAEEHCIDRLQNRLVL